MTLNEEQNNLAKRLRITQKIEKVDLQNDCNAATILLSPLEYPEIAKLNERTFSGLPIVICETIPQTTLGNVLFSEARTFEDCKDWEE